MRRKLFIIVSAAIAVLAMLFCFSACGNDDDGGKGEQGHKHTSQSYITDDTLHWKVCDDCGEAYAKGKHELDSAETCTVCGYIAKCTQGLEYKEIKDYWGNITAYSVAGIGTATDTEIIIPSFHNGKPVTNIGNNAFKYCGHLISITIGNGVTNINGAAFEGCSSLMSITIPNSVTDIWGSVFSGCSSLTKITIPSSVTRIGSDAFFNCSSLMSVTIPNSVTKIGTSVFRNCSSLTSVMMSDNVTSIGNEMFWNCSNLIRITIPDSVTMLGCETFSGCFA